MNKIIEYLKTNDLTISTMESCTGGFVSNSITNIEGSSDVFKFGAVTYSNEYKIKLGVSKDTIDKYSVYNIEVAKEMAKAISLYTKSNFGIGITGKINREDNKNLFGNDNEIFISIFDSDKDIFYCLTLTTKYKERSKNKEYISNNLIDMFEEEILERNQYGI